MCSIWVHIWESLPVSKLWQLHTLPPPSMIKTIGVYHPATLIGSQTFPMWAGRQAPFLPHSPKRKSLRTKKRRQDPRHTSARLWSGLGFSNWGHKTVTSMCQNVNLHYLVALCCILVSHPLPTQFGPHFTGPLLLLLHFDFVLYCVGGTANHRSTHKGDYIVMSN